MEKLFFELLTATVSHEMNTPINVIRTIMTNLISKPSLDRDVKKNLRIANSQAEMMRFLVKDMIDLFHIKTGKFKVKNDGCYVRDEL